MGYYASSDLDTDDAYTCHTSATGSPITITRFLQDSRSDQYLVPPTDDLTDTASNKNNMNGDRSKPINKNLINNLEINQQNTSRPLTQASMVRRTGLPQPSHLVHNATARSPNPYMLSYDTHTPYPLPRAPVEDATRKQIKQLVTSVSNNYLGNPYLSTNQSANVPDELNTSVWITNLPPGITHKILLDNVRNCGKVWAAVINEAGLHHFAAAAKIVFFDVAGAQNLLRQAREGKFVVDGYIPRVIHNRIKTEAKPLGPKSRILHIEGPSCVVNQSYLTTLFSYARITWQDEEVIILSNNGLLTRLEWRFGSYRCQAETARYLIDRVKRCTLLPPDQATIWQGVAVHFGVDPCAPNPGKYSASR
ncbi:hypothetical protein FHL15_005029 [Xylaria flabelliformis]|uniref:RRM domain-containing protein n=1 Tax=Xylaria flabelliformis TaxID=2512241 RepID=A0A553I184_9PEZI|nr:hypothetical protein FHL15_005029 [Xylaria flabelliformis]